MKQKSEILPPDRSYLQTEQRNDRTMHLHKLSVAECVKVICDEDKKLVLAMEKARKNLAAFIEKIETRFCSGGRLIYIGAGTSGRLGVLDASEIPPTFQLKANRILALIAGGDTALRISSEGKEDIPMGAKPELDSLDLTPNDTLLGIAAGGTTPYVLGALEYAKNNQPELFTSLLVCTPISKATYIDHIILIETGAEVLTGSTRMKAGTATKLALNIISTTLMIRSGKVYENLMVDLRATNNKLLDRAARIVSSLTNLNRNESFKLLSHANGDVKTAIVMYQCGLARKEAETVLNQHNYRLDKVLEVF